VERVSFAREAVKSIYSRTMGEIVLLRLEYDVKLVPAGGVEIIASSAAPVKHVGKDAAGHKFHEFALRQRGVFGEPSTSKRVQTSCLSAYTYSVFQTFRNCMMSAPEFTVSLRR
jgi:hypothetical protein